LLIIYVITHSKTAKIVSVLCRVSRSKSTKASWSSVCDDNSCTVRLLRLYIPLLCIPYTMSLVWLEIPNLFSIHMCVCVSVCVFA